MRAASRTASGTLRSMASIFMSRSFSRCSSCIEIAGGVFGFLVRPGNDAVVLQPGPVHRDHPQHVLADVRHLRERLDFASVSFGLLSTAAATSLFESRIELRALLARALHRQLHPLDDRQRGEHLGAVGFVALLCRRPSFGRGRRIDERRSASAAAWSPGADAACGKEVAHRRRHVGAGEERPQRRPAAASASVAFAVAAISGSASSDSSTSSASCSCARGASVPGAAMQAHVARHFAALEEVDERRTEPGSMGQVLG